MHLEPIVRVGSSQGYDRQETGYKPEAALFDENDGFLKVGENPEKRPYSLPDVCPVPFDAHQRTGGFRKA